jgi:hypothetical protein
MGAAIRAGFTVGKMWKDVSEVCLPMPDERVASRGKCRLGS